MSVRGSAGATVVERTSATTATVRLAGVGEIAPGSMTTPDAATVAVELTDVLRETPTVPVA